MTDKEKLLKVIDNCDDDIAFEDIVKAYFEFFYRDFPISRLLCLIDEVHREIRHKTNYLESVCNQSKGYASYLKTYLEGNMYTTKEAAIEHLPVQIKNAEHIIEWCSDYP